MSENVEMFYNCTIFIPYKYSSGTFFLWLIIDIPKHPGEFSNIVNIFKHMSSSKII